MKLPPLNPLRAFEAAARHGSFILAAEELNVTPGAISRQVKALEEHFGFAVFVRVHNGIEITPEARGLQQSLHAAFLLIEKSTKDLVGSKRDGPLNIWCSRLFMRQWLVPRLAAFQDAHPDQEVNLFGGRSDDVLPSTIDVAIRWGADDFAPWESHFLMGSHLIPVCSPAYLRAHPQLRAASDLAEHTVLCSRTRPDDWAQWLSAAGIDTPPGKRITMEGDGLAYRAAVEGLGVAIARLQFLEPDVRSGRLVMPFEQSVAADGAFWLIYPPSHRQPRKVVTFRDWLLQEAERPWHHQTRGDGAGAGVRR